MQVHSEGVANPTSALRNPWVLAVIAALVIVLSVNAIFIYLAFMTNPGLVNANYYERGQEFEQTIVSRQLRDPGWLMRADIPQPLMAGVETPIRLVLVDRAGQPVDVDEATFYAYRPSDVARDFSVTMVKEGTGRYVALTSFPLIGVWDTLVAVTVEDEEYSIGERISVIRP
ncbi:nitrogen fixation protein FixH [Thiocapsa imhoffii]|uniref:Nitrogen fixation protein FixH n=1 Tax=Thiocapsa imhoffii TaxID=382777 RepID=A0A9X0WKR7_9GAMM|nr:FixH family protein [Thiocapsa imhoffii]MBK1646230.1 nitrogen fixation protein FixH [Thiocapsa imhoffii]